MASTDSLENNTGFAEKNQATFPILADSTTKMSQAYGVLTSFGFAKRWTFYIDEGGIIRKIDKRVDVRRAGEQLVSNMENWDFRQSVKGRLDSSNSGLLSKKGVFVFLVGHLIAPNRTGFLVYWRQKGK